MNFICCAGIFASRVVQNLGVHSNYLISLMHMVNAQDQNTARQSSICSAMPMNIVATQSLVGWRNASCCSSLKYVDPQSCWTIVFVLPAFIPHGLITPLYISNCPLSPWVATHSINFSLLLHFYFSWLSWPLYLLLCIISNTLNKTEPNRKSCGLANWCLHNNHLSLAKLSHGLLFPSLVSMLSELWDYYCA